MLYVLTVQRRAQEREGASLVLRKNWCLCGTDKGTEMIRERRELDCIGTNGGGEDDTTMAVNCEIQQENREIWLGLAASGCAIN